MTCTIDQILHMLQMGWWIQVAGIILQVDWAELLNTTLKLMLLSQQETICQPRTDVMVLVDSW